MDRLALLKTLGDNTRYAIYLEIARSAVPLGTSDIAETLGLHPNTVRPHLERMRDVGLLDVEVDSRGNVGRPVHRYSVAADAPSLGLEPPAFPKLATMLASVAALSVPDPNDVALVGRDEGRALAHSGLGSSSGTKQSTCSEAIVARLAELGFDPVSSGEAVVGFARCPYRELAELYPDLVCGLHRALVEGLADGFAETLDGAVAVEDFHTLVDRDPCQVTLRSQYAHQ